MRMVALLRGINVGGNRKIPMAALCELATKVGLSDVAHYIQSGNLVFEAGKKTPEAVAVALEKAIARSFGFEVPVIVRTALQWKKYAAGSPFPRAQKDRPHLLHLGLCRKACAKDVGGKLAERATAGEKLLLAGDAIWVDFNTSVGKSKLTPAVFDKAAGSTVTMRNWNTVVKLQEMLDG